jgi:restriction system protein
MPRDPMSMTPDEFEEFVREKLAALGRGLTDLKVDGKRVLPGLEGEYEIDASARFNAFGDAEFVVLVECKRHMRPVERDVVITLEGKLHSLGAHKGMIFSTSGFQSGAIDYATAHGIALFHVQKGYTAQIAKAEGAMRDDGPFVAWRPLPTGNLLLLDPANKQLLESLFARPQR